MCKCGADQRPATPNGKWRNDIANGLRSTPCTSEQYCNNCSLVFRVKKVVGFQWGALNPNYLLVMMPTFVMPFSITVSPRMTPGCAMQRYASGCRYKPRHLHNFCDQDSQDSCASCALIPNCSNPASYLAIQLPCPQ